MVPPPPVTPHVGVWIETTLQSHTDTGLHVTPHVGVWIETCLRIRITRLRMVTPHVGVWIETVWSALHC